MRYMKKPIYVEAVRFVGLSEQHDPMFDARDGMPQWLIDAISAPEGEDGSVWVAHNGIPAMVYSRKVRIMEKDHVLSDLIPVDDWIVRGANGELSIWGDDMFQATYTAAPEPCETLETIHEQGLEALAASLEETDVDHPSDLPNGSVGRLRDSIEFVIGEGYNRAGA